MSLTLNPAALTRSLRHAGHPVSSTETVAPGAVRVHAALGAAGREAQIRRLAAELVQRGYEVATNAGRTAVTVTLPIEELAEPVELEGNPGVILIDPRTPLSAEHLADAAAEAEVIGIEGTLTELAETVDRVRIAYTVDAAHTRQDDLEAFIADATDDPAGIAYEWLDTARDLGIETGDPSVDGTLGAVLFSVAQKWVRELTVEQLEVALYAGSHTVGTRVTHRTGTLGTIVGPVEIIPTPHGDEVVVTVAFDEDETERRHPSTVTPVE